MLNRRDLAGKLLLEQVQGYTLTLIRNQQVAGSSPAVGSIPNPTLTADGDSHNHTRFTSHIDPYIDACAIGR